MSVNLQEIVGRFDLKKVGDDTDMTFAGYASVFGVRDWYGDEVARGAFEETLKAHKAAGTMPSLLLNHGSFLGGDDDTPIGIWTDMREDTIGLWAEGKLATTQRGVDTYKLLKMEHDGKPRPAMDGLSIGFIPVEWVARAKPEEPRRMLKKVDLLETSIVNWPANAKARVTQVKAATATDREIERFMLDRLGWSRSQVRALMRNGLPGLRATQDAGSESDDAMQDAGEEQLAAALQRLHSTIRGASSHG